MSLLMGDRCWPDIRGISPRLQPVVRETLVARELITWGGVLIRGVQEDFPEVVSLSYVKCLEDPRVSKDACSYQSQENHLFNSSVPLQPRSLLFPPPRGPDSALPPAYS